MTVDHRILPPKARYGLSNCVTHRSKTTAPLVFEMRTRPKLHLAPMPVSRGQNLVQTFVLGALLTFATASACGQASDNKTKTPEKTQTAEPVVVIEGQVTDAVGSGQKDVVVTLHRKKKDGTRGPKLAGTKTNKFGDFQILLPRRVDGTALVVLRKPLHKESVKEVTLTREGEIPFLAESLEGNITLTGRVVGAADDKPVPAAHVRLETAYREQSTIVDDKGAFKFTGVAPGRATIVVQADGFGRQQQRIHATQDAGTMTIVLKPQRIVQIAIVDDAGDPVSGATVELLDRPRNDMRTAITDADGIVTVKGIHFDARMLLARLTHEGHVSSIDFTERIDLPEDRTLSQHQLLMERAGKIRAEVVDAATKKPIYGARVMTGDGPSDDTPRDWTDENGIAVVTGVAPGGIVTTVHASGYAPTLSVVVVKVGETVEKTFALNKESIIQGRVEDEHGKPIPGVEIVAAQWRGYNTLGLRAMTNAKGEFLIEGAPDDEFQVNVQAPGAAPSLQSLQASDFDVVLELQLATLKALAKQFDKANQPKIGDPPPPITLTTITGKKINLAQLRGKVVVLDFWATWCAPCVQELPHIIAINEKYKNRRDFMILGISRDFDESDLRNFLKNNPRVSWDQVVGEENGSDQAAEKFGIVGIPALFVVGSDGKIAATDLDASQLQARLKLLLKSGN